MIQYYFCQFGGIYTEDELRSTLTRWTNDIGIPVGDYLSNQINQDIFIPLQKCDYVIMSNCSYRNSICVQCPNLTQNQIIQKYSRLYPAGTKITVYDYQKNKMEWIV